MDDVQFLKDNASQDSYLFQVDSAMRDRAAWKTPSEYVVQFDNPFRNVFSLQLMDASVPRTEYIISASMNALTYQLSGDQVRTVYLTPGDYDINRLVGDLNGLFQEQADASGYSLACEPLTAPPELSSKLKFFCAVPFTLYMSQSTMRNVLGFANPVRAEDAGVFYAAPPGYLDGDADAMLSLPGAADDAIVTTTFLGPGPVVAMTPVTATQYPRQMFFATQSGVVNQVQANFGLIGGPVATGDSRVSFVVRSAADGSVAASGSMVVVLDALNSPSTTAEGDITNVQPLVSGQQYYLELSDPNNGDLSNCYAVFYSQQVLPTQESALLNTMSVYSGGAWQPFVDATQELCAQVNVSQGVQQVISPGLYDLMGERYINVRCPEVEAVIYKDRAYERVNVGLGVIRLGVFGFQQQRYDYSGLPAREFHPIGKLSKLTLRFEKSNGDLYDFQGIEHTLILMVKYYSARHQQFNTQLLNPSYTPDLQRYYIDYILDPDSDDEDV